jgi:hypothetical protein
MWDIINGSELGSSKLMPSVQEKNEFSKIREKEYYLQLSLGFTIFDEKGFELDKANY